MNMSRMQKYRRIEQAAPGELERLREQVSRCPWRQIFHIQPSTGLLNDPNGFAYYQGEYHLFYQWFPLGTEHGMKYWYHMKSADLAHWQDVGIGIEPGGPYDSHGAYSGSAIEKDHKLYLMYTGNTRDADWIRNPYQCIAVMDEHGRIVKEEKPVISSVPEGYTEHFRDPKVWAEAGQYYCVIGAQRSNLTGCVLLYRSPDLKEWELLGEMETRLSHFGYMWECPDYFELADQGVLIFSPQGIEPEGEHFRNIYQSGYLTGKPLNLDTRVFEHGEFQELDRGFDFYAPQTMAAPDGRRLLVAWMGLPEIGYPTDDSGWAHCLTLPRELSLREGKLIQKPARELSKLRKEMTRAHHSLHDETRRLDGFSGVSYEMICEFSAHDADQFGIEFRAGAHERTVLKYDRLRKKVILDRSLSGQTVGEEYGLTRECTVDAPALKFQLFVDTSSVEIFINDGEEVFTSRIFPDKLSTEIRFFATGGSAELDAVMWKY
ncbi:glycoside hydrolase family 32 protein [Paenibacillus tuaregi]|uniref:glycoside hydrolase family 32 protein n=1 Tax=Paenibacillus tuaregi TaxID=1816681 RepID=UPI000837BC6A|nr:sucrose-6-phosphate hydrolase [Paenibacillus tuaregi]